MDEIQKKYFIGGKPKMTYITGGKELLTRLLNDKIVNKTISTKGKIGNEKVSPNSCILVTYSIDYRSYSIVLMHINYEH